MMELTIEKLREVAYVDDGKLFQKIKRSQYPAGRRMGCFNDRGYRVVSLYGRVLKEHRVIWALEKGSWPKGDITHINGYITDNRIENLKDLGA